MPTSLGTGAPPWVLRPGTPVLTRAPGVLQVGLSGPSARLPDEPAVRRLLAALASPAGQPAGALLAEAAGAALGRLRAAGLVVAAPAAPPAPGLAVLLAQFGPDAERRHAARGQVAVHVRSGPGTVLAAAPAPAAVLAELIAEAGLRTTDDPSAGDAVHLLVQTGPIPRDSLDALVRDSVPHLLVAGDATGVRVGPFVEPGRTACLRCVDAHESVPDERRPLLLAQAAAQALAQPAPRDPLLDRLALAWAVRDLVSYAEHDEPTTWSATVDLTPQGAPLRTAWGRHPYCGCAWDGFLDLP